MLPLTSVVLAAATWYLTGMAEITRALWSRYPDWLTRWVSCPACAGAWWCAGWTVVFCAAGWSWFGVELPWAAPLGLLWGVFWVPLAAKALDWSLRTLGWPL